MWLTWSCVDPLTPSARGLDVRTHTGTVLDMTAVDSSALFRVTDKIEMAGDQPRAVSQVVEQFQDGHPVVVLAGATGTGKSATSAWVIERMNRPTLVLAPNKVLAAQLASELRELLPGAHVGFFVSHFAYYRPEAYVPASDTYIEKDSAIDQDIERLRHEATVNALTRKDTVIVASVSALYALGRPEEYRARALFLTPDGEVSYEEVIAGLVKMGYSRNDAELTRGRFRVRGDVIDVHPAAQESLLRLEFFGSDLETVSWMDPLTLDTSEVDGAWVFPVSHHVVPEESLSAAIDGIEEELTAQLAALRTAGKELEAQRLEQRTREDLESLRATGFCRGVENYSRHFDRRAAGEPPATLLEYLPEDFLLVVDESHVTIPQVQAMFEADQSRKRVLVEHGFRLPSALDNRPLSFGEFLERVPRVLALSATPGAWEYENAPQGFVDQVVRPTGLVDPTVEVLPQRGRMEALLERIRAHTVDGRRALVTTVSKAQAETLADFLLAQGVRARFLHSDVSTVDRIALLRDLRRGALDVIVGVNLLREGLDLPEVGLVAILDADTRGFLRSGTSLIQTIGRAARNTSGEVLLFADEVTPAMRMAIEETDRRRALQLEHNRVHGIVPQPLSKPIVDVLASSSGVPEREMVEVQPGWDLHEVLLGDAAAVRKEMQLAAEALRFEEAAALRDEERRILLEARELADGLRELGVLPSSG